MNDKLKEMMDRRRKSLGLPSPTIPVPLSQSATWKKPLCFEVQVTEGYSEHFLNLRFHSGDRAAFPYAGLTYINLDEADSRIDLNFSGYIVSIYGQNLAGELYDSLLNCKVRQINETPGTSSPAGIPSVRAIVINPPGGTGAEDVLEEEQQHPEREEEAEFNGD